MTTDPLLSICIAGRNDNYGFDFKRRFSQAMNFLAWSSRRANVHSQIEVVFADWNSEIPISRELRLSEDAVNMIRFIEVPPKIARPLNPSRSPFSQSVAFNTAFRRTKGAYIGVMPADVLLTSHALRNLIGILSGRIPVSFDPEMAVISIPRKNIPYYASEARYFSSPEKIEQILLTADAWMLCDNTARGMMGGYGLFIQKRELLFAQRGVDERIAGWGYNDTDLALRCADRAPVINTMGYGICSYDFEPSFSMLMQKELRRASFHPIHLGFAENTENWGLADQKLQESRAQIGSMLYPEMSAKPDKLPWRDWILWLSQRISPIQVPFFTATAMLAGWIAMKNNAERIFLYGTKDRSILTLLALSVPFAEIVIHERYETEDDHERIWRSDNSFGPLHHIGHVHYLPEINFIHTEPADLIIVNTSGPVPDILRKNSKEGGTILIAPSYVTTIRIPGLPQKIINRITVYQKGDFDIPEAEKNSKPMKGNIVSLLLQFVIAQHNSKIQKLWRIFFRQNLWGIFHACSVIKLLRKIY